MISLFSDEVARALREKQPLVALESTVITHGLPYPENLRLALSMEAEIRFKGCVPATIAVLEGIVRVGLTQNQIEHLAQGKDMDKISSRDFASAIVNKKSGGTTVAGTLVAAHIAGIRVFATGGIGGVHRQAPFDVSADLYQLTRSQLVVVCAGAKAILDLPATLEMLESLGVPVVGYQTDEFPAFYVRSSGLRNSVRVESPEEVAAIANTHWELGLPGSILVTLPPPETVALDSSVVEIAITQALAELKERQIQGQAVTPFLLRRVSELTHGESLKANLALLLNNASLAARISCQLTALRLKLACG